jgi:hypothetical protein
VRTAPLIAFASSISGEGTYRLAWTCDRARAFWSITLYDSDGYQAPNALNRFAVSSWMPWKYNADGSLDLYFFSNAFKRVTGNAPKHYRGAVRA